MKPLSTSTSEAQPREPWLHWFALAVLALLGLVRCVVGVLFQGWMTAYYPSEQLTSEMEAKLLHNAIGYSAGAIGFLALLAFSSWRTARNLSRNRALRAKAQTNRDAA
jgi:hypothetical protein